MRGIIVYKRYLQINPKEARADTLFALALEVQTIITREEYIDVTVYVTRSSRRKKI